MMYNNPLYIAKEGDERGNMGDLEVSLRFSKSRTSIAFGLLLVFCFIPILILLFFGQTIMAPMPLTFVLLFYVFTFIVPRNIWNKFCLPHLSKGARKKLKRYKQAQGFLVCLLHAISAFLVLTNSPAEYESAIVRNDSRTFDFGECKAMEDFYPIFWAKQTMCPLISKPVTRYGSMKVTKSMDNYRIFVNELDDLMANKIRDNIPTFDQALHGALLKCLDSFRKKACMLFAYECNDACQISLIQNQSMALEYQLCKIKNNDKFLKECDDASRTQIAKGASGIQLVIDMFSDQAKANIFAGKSAKFKTENPGLITDMETMVDVSILFMFGISLDAPMLGSSKPCSEVLAKHDTIFRTVPTDLDNSDMHANCSSEAHDRYLKWSSASGGITSTLHVRGNNHLWYAQIGLAFATIVSTLSFGVSLSLDKFELVKVARSRRHKHFRQSVQILDKDKFNKTEKLQLGVSIAIDMIIVVMLVIKLLEFDFAHSGARGNVYVIIMYTLTALILVISIMATVENFTTLLRCAIHVKTKTRNEKHLAVNPILKCYKKWHGHVNLRSGSYFFVKSAVWEFREIVCQLLSFDALLRTNDLQYVITATSLIGINITVSPLLYHSRMCLKNRVEEINIRRGIYAFDATVELMYFMLNMTYVKLSNFTAPGSPISKMALIYASLYPAITIMWQMRSLRRATAVKVIERTMKRWKKKKKATGMVIPLSEQSFALQKSQYRKLIVERIVVGSIASLGFGFLVYFLQSCAFIDKYCASQLGTTLWRESEPRHVFAKGPFTFPTCNFQSILQIDANNTLLNKLPEVTQLPETLCKLHNLESLNLANNKINTLPKCMEINLTKLEVFNVNDNPVSRVLDWSAERNEAIVFRQFPWKTLRHLKSTLIQLSLANNELETVDKAVSNFKHLRRLDVSFNKITAVSSFILPMGGGEFDFRIEGNPIQINLTIVDSQNDVWPQPSFRFLENYFGTTLRYLDLSRRSTKCSEAELLRIKSATNPCAETSSREYLCSGDLVALSKAAPNLNALFIQGHCLRDLSSSIINISREFQKIDLLDVSNNPIRNLDDSWVESYLKANRVLECSNIQDVNIDLDVAYFGSKAQHSAYVIDRDSTVQTANIFSSAPGQFLELGVLCDLHHLKQIYTKEFRVPSSIAPIPMCVTNMKELVVLHLDIASSRVEQYGRNYSSVMELFALPKLEQLVLRDIYADANGFTNAVGPTYIHKAPAVVTPTLKLMNIKQFCFNAVLNNQTFSQFKHLVTLSMSLFMNQSLSNRHNRSWCSGNPNWAGMHVMEKLKNLRLEHDFIDGSLPDHVGLPSTMDKLIIDSHPRLTGTLPVSWFHKESNQRIKTLIIRETGIGSVIPASLGNLSHLVLLDLSRNALNGALPVQSLENIHGLKVLNLAHNSGLSGTLSINILDKLEYLDLHGTNIIIDPAFKPSSTMEYLRAGSLQSNYSLSKNYSCACTVSGNKKLRTLSSWKRSYEITGYPKYSDTQFSNSPFCIC